MKIVVFSDLDATLLDAETYSWRPAEEAIDALKKREAAIIPVTSKTVSEVVLLHEELGLEDPFIFENGGGIAACKGTPLLDYLISREPKLNEFHWEGFVVFPLGMRYEMLVRSLAEISAEVGAPLLGFSALSNEGVAEATGLRPEQAARARMRLFDEPFMISEESIDLEAQIRGAATRRGLDVVKGGRFWHLIGHAGKRKAVSMLIEASRKVYGELVTIGLGDSPNDFPFLQVVDIPVVLGKTMKSEFVFPLSQRAHRYDVPGPGGWNQAVLDILATL
jgi:mannosyl-3-phosphoglycerate phosphatase